MSLRITQGILFSQALNNIQRANSEGFAVRNQISTGRRFSRPSEDPSGLMQVLPLRSEVRDLEQTQSTLALARRIADNAAAALQNSSETMAHLREQTLLAANGTTSASDRQALLSQVNALLDQMLSSANSKWGNRSLFAGAAVDVTPFEIVDGPNGSRIVYHGDQSTTEINVTAGITTELNVPGDRAFLSRNRQPTTFDGSTGAAPSGAADSGVGFDLLDVSFARLSFPGGPTGLAQGDNSTTALGSISYSFAAGSPATLSLNGGPPQAITGGVQSFAVGTGSDTISLDVTTPISPTTGTIVSEADLSTDGGQTLLRVDDFTPGVNYQVRNADGTVLNVDASGLTRTGTERVKYEGTFDAFTTLISIRDVLTNERNEPDSVVATRLGDLLGEIDFAHDGILSGLQEIGNRSQNMELFENRLSELELVRRQTLSEIEDVDFAEAVLRLSQQDIAFQASIQVGARSVQTSLMNFLR